MRKLLFTQLVWLLGVAMFSLSGCDIFGDEDKCQYETTESRVWQSGRDVAFSPRDTSVTFCFNRSGVLSERSFQINNVCPLGVLAVKVDLKEKGSFLPPQPTHYRILLVEYFENNNLYKIRSISALYRQNETELKGQFVVDMFGIPEEGPRQFFVGVAAIFEPGQFTNLLDMETWAQEHVDRVTFTAGFVRYE